MKENVFPKNFIWGAATASYQIEGAYNEDGRGMSIWDTFCRKRGKVANGENADVACDHYHRYKDDVAIMKKLNLKAYRTSISWPRVIPEGKGAVNQAGLDFYDRLTDELLANNIIPLYTLFHWDLPDALQKNMKGFENRDIVNYFADYTDVVVSRLGDRVKNWITFNEPWVYAALGHFFGYHAPGKRSIKLFFNVMHHQLMAHGAAIKKIREISPDSSAGITLNLQTVYPNTERPKDENAALIAHQFINGVALDPLYKGGYPGLLFDRFRQYTPDIKDGDFDLIMEKTDFIGINNYTRNFVAYRWYIPYLKAEFIDYKAADKEFFKGDTLYTTMGWEVYPKGLYEVIMMLKNDYDNPPIYITENGCSLADELVDGKVHDEHRVNFLRDYISAVGDAVEDGADVRGYFVWSLFDNFEWALGYNKRFGIVRVDYETQERIIKDSGLWYRDFIAAQSK